MKYFLFFCMVFLYFFISAQQDTVRTLPVPEDRKTSYESGEIWIIAIVGLIILIALYFLFRRMRRLKS